MDEKDFQELLDEIDTMSTEEYNEYHKKAIKMKKSDLTIQESSQEHKIPS